jgi:hypothetical protein
VIGGGSHVGEFNEGRLVLDDTCDFGRMDYIVV